MRENVESLLLELRTMAQKDEARAVDLLLQEEARADDLLLQLHAAHQREADMKLLIRALEAKVLLLQGLRG
jgi:predicted amino acid racemase